MQSKENFCAPHKQDLERETGSCLTHAELISVGKAYNSSHQGIQIPRNIFATKRALHKELSIRFAEKCKGLGEHCWARSYNVDSYRPEQPASWSTNEREWLNTYDILLVMRQYEKQHKQFRFVGVFPRDFATKRGDKCVSSEMCEKDLKRGKKELGFVFNHDAHNQQGSHWVALFVDLNGRLSKDKQPTTFYYDSQGFPPKQEIMEFVRSMGTHCVYNRVQQQYKNTECGMFSINFLVACLEAPLGTTFHEVVQGLGNDEDAFALRRHLFAPTVVAPQNDTALSKVGGGRRRKVPKIKGTVRNCHK
jgi:hypothetical protein